MRIRCCQRALILLITRQRLLVTAVMVAAKFLEDEVQSNATWSRPASASTALTSHGVLLRCIYRACAIYAQQVGLRSRALALYAHSFVHEGVRARDDGALASVRMRAPALNRAPSHAGTKACVVFEIARARRDPECDTFFSK